MFRDLTIFDEGFISSSYDLVFINKSILEDLIDSLYSTFLSSDTIGRIFGEISQDTSTESEELVRLLLRYFLPSSVLTFLFIEFDDFTTLHPAN